MRNTPIVFVVDMARLVSPRLPKPIELSPLISLGASRTEVSQRMVVSQMNGTVVNSLFQRYLSLRGLGMFHRSVQLYEALRRTK